MTTRRNFFRLLIGAAVAAPAVALTHKQAQTISERERVARRAEQIRIVCGSYNRMVDLLGEYERQGIVVVHDPLMLKIQRSLASKSIV